VGHHGSGGSSGEEFLKVIDPEIGIVSVGKNNYGHPTEEVLDRLEDEGVEVLRTDLLGDIEIVSDGSRYWVK